MPFVNFYKRSILERHLLMGTKMEPVFPNLLMGYLEEHCLSEYVLTPVMYSRYIDDFFPFGRMANEH